VKHLADLETPSQDQAEAEQRKRNKVTLCVEGNISAGKSTFLQKLLKSSVELRDIIEVFIPLPTSPAETYLLNLPLRWFAQRKAAA
jgi:hypothetical protein